MQIRFIYKLVGRFSLLSLLLLAVRPAGATVARANGELNLRPLTLADRKEWTEFESTDSNYKILSGTADMDILSTRQMPGMEGKLFEGATLRLLIPKPNCGGCIGLPAVLVF